MPSPLTFFSLSCVFFKAIWSLVPFLYPSFELSLLVVNSFSSFVLPLLFFLSCSLFRSHLVPCRLLMSFCILQVWFACCRFPLFLCCYLSSSLLQSFSEPSDLLSPSHILSLSLVCLLQTPSPFCILTHLKLPPPFIVLFWIHLVSCHLLISFLCVPYACCELPLFIQSYFSSLLRSYSEPSDLSWFSSILVYPLEFSLPLVDSSYNICIPLSFLLLVHSLPGLPPGS